MRVPGIPYVQGRNSYSDSDGRHYGIAIHNTSNNASDSNEAAYATRRTDGVSSHFYVDSDSVTQSLDTDARAGHAGSAEGNGNAIAVEITGANGWSRQQWLDRVAWAELGRVLAHVITHDPDYAGFEVRRASVAEMKANPRVKAFYGHDDMRRAWGGTTHTDPGPDFPWDLLLGAVSAALAGESEDDMALTDDDVKRIAAAVANFRWPADSGQTLYSNARDANLNAAAARKDVVLLRTEVAQQAGRDLVDEQQIADAVLAGLGSRDLGDVAAALRAALGTDRAAELAALLAAPVAPAP